MEMLTPAFSLRLYASVLSGLSLYVSLGSIQDKLNKLHSPAERDTKLRVLDRENSVCRKKYTIALKAMTSAA
ncbi:hypothetical protein [Undibacterium sp. Xuan67W]|uniref:hypothetical protein n=1 Tax=Undibacterium sp. Xuan67W TaxID=3413057 RepID=UPI003BF2824B